jgi:hypothetical protein
MSFGTSISRVGCIRTKETVMKTPVRPKTTETTHGPSAVEAARQKSTLRAAGGNGRSPAPIREEEIRKRAYFLWEKEGWPQGRHGHHWKLAEYELESEASNAPNLEALREASRQHADAFLVKTDIEDADQREASPGTCEQD